MKERGTIINETAPFDISVLQYGFPRSGSTLMRQICTRLFTSTTTTHDYFNKIQDYIIGTVRDPRDMIVSFWRINQDYNTKNKMNNQDIDLIVNHLKYRFFALKRYLKENDCIWFKYIDIYNDFDYIFNRFEEEMNIKISSDLRNEIKINSSLKENKKISDKLEKFSILDSKTGIHGNHIYTGEPGTWKEFVEDESYLNLRLNFWIDRINKL